MFRRPSLPAADPRRGVILLVVITMLTLFAIVGLSFVLYADSEAKSSQIFREVEQLPGQRQPGGPTALADMDPEFLLSYFLGQFVFDVPDDAAGVHSAMRGHTLARTQYGYNDDLIPLLGAVPVSNVYKVNLTPFNGTGRLHTAVQQYPPAPLPPLFAADDHDLVNYMYFQADNFLRDPERLGTRANLASPKASYLGGFNPPYTYPDLNNLFLSAVKANGEILMQSFHRDWHFRDPSANWPSPSGPPSYDKTSLHPLNPNWTTPVGKYLTLRPRPIDMGPGFPYPEDEGGDVKNLVGFPGYTFWYMDPTPPTPTLKVKQFNNDSIWMDLGAPVLTATNGKKYKALFAPLIMDLDNRINLNVSGNILGMVANTGPGATPSPTPPIPTHASNQGWGAWTVNLGKVLNVDSANDTPTAPAVPGYREWVNLFLGTPTYLPFTMLNPPVPPVPALQNRYDWPTPSQGLPQLGRYGGQPWAIFTPPTPPIYGRPGDVSITGPVPTAPPFGPTPHFYAKVDYEGRDETSNSQLTAPIDLPGINSVPVTSCFPNYPAGYGNGAPGTPELDNHPLLYNFNQPGGDDRSFTVSNMEALLRAGDTGSASLTSAVVNLAPQNFANFRIRNLVTTHSFDIDRPGLTPWLWQDPAATTVYSLTGPYPQGLALKFPTPPTPPTALTAQPTEFSADWRAAMPLPSRLDLNRYLPPYPAPTGATIDMATPATAQQFVAAQQARQDFAQDIFNLLQTVTGSNLPGPGGAPPVDPNAQRWIGQLAVNMVDYIDSDDYMTPFKWNGTEVIWGTELPRLVLNEVYAEVRNDPTDPGPGGAMKKATLPYQVNFWVELHNTFFTDPTLSDNGDALLHNGTNAIYQVEIGTGPDPGIATDATNLGNLTNSKLVLSDYTPDPTSTSPPANLVKASNGAFSDPGKTNVGFFVIGPKLANDPEGASPAPAATLRVNDGANNSMTYTLPNTTSIPTPPDPHVVALRRLACPHLPPNTTPTAPDYNPYLTVDYMDNIPTHDGRLADSTALLNSGMAVTAVASRAAYGKTQPYAAHSNHIKQQAPSSALTGQPQHTFFQHNAVEPPPGPPVAGAPGQTLKVPFDWLVHLDRPLVSPIELLHVSAYKPQQLTQQFTTAAFPGPSNFQHNLAAIVFDQTARLYRMFEFIETRNRAAGQSAPTVTLNTAVPPPPGTWAKSTGLVNVSALDGVSATGTPWQIRPGDVVIIEPGTANQENVRVVAVNVTGGPLPAAPLPNFQADFVRPHPATATILLTNTGERLPGKININTIWDVETLRALCDAQSSNGFYGGAATPDSQIDAIFANIISTSLAQARTKGPGGTPSPTDQPFRGLAAGVVPTTGDLQYKTGLGIDDTFLRVAGATRLFEVPGKTHPAERFELMSKIFNNVTTRSNVFAVWLTVGFFEVTDDTTRPVKLGAEIGKAEGKHVRHRMFAIVDRTNLAIQGNKSTYVAGAASGIPAAVATVPKNIAALSSPLMSLSALSGTFTLSPPTPSLSWKWNITQGTALVLNKGQTNEETVFVTNVFESGVPLPDTAPAVTVEYFDPTPPASFKPGFAQNHAIGETIHIYFTPGNPGPQPTFNLQGNSAVVPYFSIIQ